LQGASVQLRLATDAAETWYVGQTESHSAAMTAKPSVAKRFEKLLRDFAELPRADHEATYEYVEDHFGAFSRPPQRITTSSEFRGYEMATIEGWAIRAEAALVEIFGPADSRTTRFQSIMNEGGWNQINRLEVANRLRAVIESAQKDVLEGLVPEPPTQQTQGNKSKRPGPDGHASSPTIFVVHGRDEAAKEAVARFLHKLKLKPIILHEEPNRGHTIIEKFEANAAVEFAVVLLTPDDEGNPKGLAEERRPRARQNVILELGYFIGRIGRPNVCALYKSGVELPSDFDGVAYVAMDDSHGWKLLLARELKTAGIVLDLNDAM
jgi:predicted nucleotide-binding protein